MELEFLENVFEEHEYFVWNSSPRKQKISKFMFAITRFVSF